MTRLGPHFVLSEFDCRDGTKVPARAVKQLEALVRDQLEPLREKFGVVTVHSGYRTLAWNRQVGGATRSFHRYDLRRRWGVAADVTCQHGSPAEWADFLDRRRAGGVGRYATFVHVDNRRVTARWSG